MSRRRRNLSGFTLIEALVVLVITAVLLAKGIPAFQEMLANMRLRDTAESLQTTLQLARSEAIRRNTTVQFYLLDGLTAACAPSATGSNWAISLADITAATDKCSSAADIQATTTTAANAGILSKGTVPGTSGVAIATTAYQDDGITLMSPAPSALCYTGFGLLSATCAGTHKAIRFSVAPTAASGQTCATLRCLQVCVSAGLIKMCDPALTDPTDPRACSTSVDSC